MALTKLSKKDIVNFQNNLEKKKQKTEKQIELLKKSDPFADPDHAIDNAAIDTDVREQIGHDTIQAEIYSLEKNLELINRALKKISRLNYGKCEKCHKIISKSRLNIIPQTRYCVDCEKKLIK